MSTRKTKAPAKKRAARRSEMPPMREASKLEKFKASKAQQQEPASEQDAEPAPEAEPISEQKSDAESAAVTIKMPPPPETPEPTKAMTLRLSLPAWRQLKFMAIEEGCPAHTLMIDAVNDLFVKHGKLPIA